MGRIESFSTEKVLMDRIEQLKSNGLEESRMTVISGYGLPDTYERFAEVKQKRTDRDPWDGIVAWFQGEVREEEVMSTLELTNLEKEEYKTQLYEGLLLLYIDYDERAFSRFTSPDSDYTYKDQKRPRRRTSLDHTVKNDLTGAPEERRMENTGEENFELRKEDLVVDKEKKQVGEVIVNKFTESEVQDFDVPLDHEHVTVERRKLEDEPLFETYSHDESDDEEGVIRIPITKERIKIVREQVVTEEVIVRKKIVTDNKHISEVVRHEDINVIERKNEES
ncbi:YsnF/AvaK domain-containing protein [Lacicoccus qingdaonensis]|uniref:Conserved domain-containing protein n=1 Tax=Lacicoccus qingdaonensis TaxID=576118 RepID=A0A1G9J2D6_9BACL|nr:DUF2382 domain-containing protein [Salinicoccus qingdaonensis]SDL31383.1 conserved domain-containing protein [Salinicoccus qingdaonensis]